MITHTDIFERIPVEHVQNQGSTISKPKCYDTHV